MPVMQFRVAALINDSVGTLAGGCYVDADTKIGVILGTGTNACYAEQRSNIAALAKSKQNGREQQHPLMAINTEWGNFAAPSSPFTDVRPPTAAQAQALPGSAGDATALSAGLKTLQPHSIISFAKPSMGPSSCLMYCMTRSHPSPAVPASMRALAD